MATKRPSYLKRRKEQKRAERAAEKRATRKLRKQARSDESADLAKTGEEIEALEGVIP